MTDLGGISYPFDPTPTKEERNWALLAHLSPVLASFLGVGPLGPLVVYLVKREESPFVAKSALQALAFSIGVYLFALVVGLIGILLSCIGIGILILVALGTLLTPIYLVYVVIGMLRASEGSIYEYPFTGTYVK